MAEARKAYVVREAGTPARRGKVYKVYPYDLRSLISALEDARFRSFTGEPQVIIKVDGTTQTVFRRYENGREVPVEPSSADPPQ